MAYLAFLVAIMVFAADPMAAVAGACATRATASSRCLQHPAMLHPSADRVPGLCGLGRPLCAGRGGTARGRLDDAWMRAGAALGAVRLGDARRRHPLGADWAYEELGWGGYWAWDPVENGSLMPWLTGTALIHGLMTWRQAALKKTTLFLAIATFGLCNFATFLTRSGIFSSLHAFSQSPIGWMFLAWIAALGGGRDGADLCGGRAALRAEQPLAALWSREAWCCWESWPWSC